MSDQSVQAQLAERRAARQAMLGAVDGPLPADVLRECEDRLDASLERGVSGWAVGADLAAKALGLASETMRLGASRMDLSFARVAPSPTDPRRFALAAARGDSTGATPGEVALIWPLAPTEDMAAEPWPADLVAVSLSRGRFWRLTCLSRATAECADTGTVYTLCLRQDVRAYLAALIAWNARERRAEMAGAEAYTHVMRGVRLAADATDLDAEMRTPEEPERQRAFLEGFRRARAARLAAETSVRNRQVQALPRGILVLDPAAIDWTRRGWMRDVETVEILDAPATGALGRAIRARNKTVGTSRGAMLVGTERDAQPQRRRAA